MPGNPEQESWEQIEQIVERGDSEGLAHLLSSMSPGEVARALSRLDEEDQESMLTLLDPEEAADVLSELSDVQAAELLDDMPPETVAAIMEEMESADRADLLAELEEDEAEAILQKMDPEEAATARRLMAYDEHTAGGLMITEYLAYQEHLTVADVLRDMRDHAERYSDYGIQYCYVVSKEGVLSGVLRLRDLVLSPGFRPITSVMIPNPVRVHYSTHLDELEQFFDRHTYLGAPVVDDEGRLLGIVERSAIEEATHDRADRNFLHFSGIVGGEELRSLPLAERVPKRLSWLVINIFLNIIAASVIAFFEGTLQQVIALAVFLPIVSDMSGNCGSQAVAVSVRELTLGIVKPRDLALVVWKEVQVGVFLGIALGALLGLVAVVWKGNIYLGLVIGAALAINTWLAACLGGAMPLMLKWMRLDPALVSGPLLTTFTDMFGFLLVLGFATMCLSYL